MSGALAGPFVLDAFEAVARVQPEVPAVALEDGRVCSYGELDRLATHISRVVRLMMSRSPPSEAFDDGKINTPLVALMMNRDVAFIASMLGVLKAEAGYVPVDPTFPSDRQSYIFEQSKCMCLVIDTENYQAALDLGVTLPKNVVRVDSKTCQILDPALREDDLPAPVPASSRVNDADSLAYILYTSGSTGRPKGVMVKNAGVMNQIDWFAADLQSGPHTRVLGLATFCFDISVLEIYLPLTRGGLLMLAVASTQKDPFRIAELIQEHKINFFQATPTTYDMLFATGWAGDPNIDFLVGGEAFRPSLIKAVRNCHSFRNVYGPTETTVWASGFVVPKDFTAESLPPVGVPGLNYVFRIIDHEHGPPWKEVGPGQEGELWIGGSNVGRGYLGRADLSREVYLPDMFAGHGLIYRTGDLVKQLPDGNYYYLQRIDNQVKIDGFRIELQEIENVYLGNDKIEQCVVLLRGKRLVLYVKPAPHFSPLFSTMLADIHAEAGKKLMYYMMPKATVIVEKFDLTATGKIDRKPLPDPPEQLDQDTSPEGASGSGSGSGSGTGTGASSMALSVASTASSVVRMEDVIIRAIENMRGKRPAATSNFGSIGVDSLGAVMFIKYLSDLFGGVRISPKELYSPGVTIRTFSLSFHERLVSEKPQQLASMGLSLNPLEGLSEDVESHGVSRQLGYADESDAKEAWEREQEESFEAIILRNKTFLEGLRGLFTFLVLWDHYHRNDVKISNAFVADTSLFVVYSGFATVFQWREVPRYMWSDPEARIKALSADPSGLALPAAATERMLLPRPPFNWRMYLVSRAIGVFPILWVALVIFSPFWAWRIQQRRELEQAGVIESNPEFWKDEEICVVLYVFALNCWYRKDVGGCKVHGPNSMLYASIIWGIFIMYVLWRVPLERFQNWATSLSVRGGGAWRAPLRALFERLSYNRPASWNELALWVFCYAGASIAFTSALLTAGMKNSLSFVPHFFLGVTGAHVFESIHYLRFKTRRQGLGGHGESGAKRTAAACHVISMGDADAQDSEGQLGQQEQVEMTTSDAGNAECGPSTSQSQSQPPVRHSDIFMCLWQPTGSTTAASRKERTARFLWRFFPDALSVVVGITMSTLTKQLDARDERGPVSWFMYCGLPVLLLAFGIVSMLQEDRDAHNGSRFFCESIVMTSLGYCSYPLYLLQIMTMNTWRPVLEHYSETGEWIWDYSGKLTFQSPNTGPFGQPQHSVGYMTAAMLCLIACSYALQYLVQDCLVGFLFSKAVTCIGRSRADRAVAAGSAM